VDVSKTVQCCTGGLVFERKRNRWREGSNLPAAMCSVDMVAQFCDFYGGGTAVPTAAVLSARLGHGLSVVADTEFCDGIVTYVRRVASLNKVQRDFFFGYVALVASTNSAINKKAYRALLADMGDFYRVIDRLRFLRKVLSSPRVVLTFLADPESFPLELLSSRRSKTEASDEALKALCSERTDLYTDIIEPLMVWKKARVAAVRNRQHATVKTISHEHLVHFVRYRLGLTKERFTFSTGKHAAKAGAGGAATARPASASASVSGADLEQAQDDGQVEQQQQQQQQRRQRRRRRQQAASSDDEAEGDTGLAGPEVQADAHDVLYGEWFGAEEVRRLIGAQSEAGPRRSLRLQAEAKLQAKKDASAVEMLAAIDKQLAEAKRLN
jgi:hypothetical protein